MTVRVKYIGKAKRTGKSRWRIEVENGIDPSTGRRKRLVRQMEGRENEALVAAAELEKELDEGTYIEPCKLSIKEYLEQWLKDDVKNRVQPLTYDSYEQQIKNHLTPGIGNIHLEKLQPLHLQKHYSKELASGLSPRSVQYQHAIIRKALDQAVKWQMLRRNVATLVTPPKKADAAERKRTPRALTTEEREALIVTAFGTHYYNLIQIALLTGLRRGELLALEWKYIDLKKRYLSVLSALQRVQGVGLAFGDTKTKGSMRTIPFLAACLPVFKAIKRERAKDRFEHGKRYQDLDIVFCNEYGLPLDPANVSHQVKKLIVKAKIPNASLHSLRHTFASSMIAKGVPIEQVQALLGHESISTTMGTYHHILPGVLEDTLSRIEKP